MVSKSDTEIVCTTDFANNASSFPAENIIEIPGSGSAWGGGVGYIYWDLDGGGVPPTPTSVLCPETGCSTAGGFLLTVKGRDFGTDPSALTVEIQVGLIEAS